jgi:hypothetical protein
MIVHTSQVLYRTASRLVALTPNSYLMYCERCGAMEHHATYDNAVADADAHTEHN